MSSPEPLPVQKAVQIISMSLQVAQSRGAWKMEEVPLLLNAMNVISTALNIPEQQKPVQQKLEQDMKYGELE